MSSRQFQLLFRGILEAEEVEWIELQGNRNDKMSKPSSKQSGETDVSTLDVYRNNFLAQ